MAREIINLPPPPPEGEKELRQELAIVCTYTNMLIADSQTKGSLEIGSAELVRIGGRLFAATANHCIGKAPYLVFGDRFALPAPPTPLLNCIKHPSLDIGVLELLPDSTPHGCSVENLDTAAPVLPTDPRSPKPPFHFVVGYPWDERKLAGDLLGMKAVAFGTHPIKVEDHRYQFTYPLRFAHYEGEKLVIGDKPVTPHGFSGGGVWQFVPPAEGKLYTPADQIRLCGIQYAWGGAVERQVYVVPISYWIKVVYDNYPDLQDLLAAKFPFLKGGA
jgi:hypothetical protein